jgi:Aldo/keto reductase family
MTASIDGHGNPAWAVTRSTSPWTKVHVSTATTNASNRAPPGPAARHRSINPTRMRNDPWPGSPGSNCATGGEEPARSWMAPPIGPNSSQHQGRVGARPGPGRRAPGGVEILTKTYWVTGPGWNDRGLSRKHILEGIDGSLRRLQTDHVDLYQAHRYDHETPLEETMLAFADIVRQGKAIYIGVGVAGRGDPRRGRVCPRAAGPADLESAAVLDAVAGHRGRGHPDLPRTRHRADRVVADRARGAHRKAPARPAAACGVSGPPTRAGRQ